ncbi:MAG: hypothetical protein QGI60_05360 [archaeon]|jgi:hypothetical protein|nr:hypothetical protein [archaeon]
MVEKIARKFWSSKRIVTFFLILFGIFVGMLVQHYYLEPLLSDDCVDDLRFCKTQVSVLNEENNSCYQQNYDLDRLLKDCERNLELFREQG